MKIKIDNRKKTLTLLLIFIIGICIICILCFFMYQNLTTENYSDKTFEDGYYLLGNTYYYFQTDTFKLIRDNGTGLYVGKVLNDKFTIEGYYYKKEEY